MIKQARFAIVQIKSIEVHKSNDFIFKGELKMENTFQVINGMTDVA